MEEKLLKLREYLKMETEIPFDEFKEYHSSVIGQLNSDYNEMDQDSCLKARYICNIVQANAEDRGAKSKINGKAFKKMASKCKFWSEAIEHRLKKEGLTQEAIDSAMSEINKDMEK